MSQVRWRRRSLAMRVLRFIWKILRTVLAACCGLGPVPPPLPPRTPAAFYISNDDDDG